MGLGSIFKKIAGIGSIVAAPFTGGTSLSFLPALLGAGAGIAGALSNTQGARTGQQTNTTMPVENPAYASLGELLRSRAMQRLNSSMDMSGYEANGIRDINSTFSPISTSVNNSLTSRGLATSPVAGAADATLGAARGSSIAQYLATLPQIQRQMQNEDFSAAAGLYSAAPRGSTQSGTVINPGSAVGSGIGSAAELLAYLHGQGLFGSKTPDYSQVIH